MTSLEGMAGYIFNATFTAIATFLLWGKQQDKKKLTSNSEELIRLKSQMVTETKVREIVTDVLSTAITPMHDTIKDIKRLVMDNSDVVHQLQIKMAAEEGYKEAMQGFDRRNKK